MDTNEKIVNVLGTPYAVKYSTEGEDPCLKHCDGYCDETVKVCVVQREPADPGDPMNISNYDEYRKRVARHELIHAFFKESGLGDECAFACDEVCVDWIARQAPKIVRAFDEAGVLW